MIGAGIRGRIAAVGVPPTSAICNLGRPAASSASGGGAFEAGGAVAVTGSNTGQLIAWALDGPRAGHALHHQPHSPSSFGPLTRVQPLGHFPYDASARLVSMQTSDPAGECVESVKVWIAVPHGGAESVSVDNAYERLWHCVLAVASAVRSAGWSPDCA